MQSLKVPSRAVWISIKRITNIFRLLADRRCDIAMILIHLAPEFFIRFLSGNEPLQHNIDWFFFVINPNDFLLLL